MFCTGGIRCEKASVFLEKKGFKNVYQLKGGILNYLKSIKKKDSLWKGECFFFDKIHANLSNFDENRLNLYKIFKMAFVRIKTKNKKIKPKTEK